MIAVTFALPAESSDFVARLRRRSRQVEHRITGSLGENEVTVLHTGVGGAVARKRIAHFLNSRRPEWLISAGFAGALTSDLAVGATLLAKNFSEPSLLDRAQRALGPKAFSIGNLVTTEAVIDSLGERHALAQASGALAVEMETRFIAQACGQAMVPMLSVRAITDTPDLPFPTPPAVLFDIDRQKTNPARLLVHLARHPATIPRLIAFARRVAFARRSLTNALEQIILNLPV